MTVIAPLLADLDLDLPDNEPFTAAQARAAGVPAQRLAALAKTGVLRRLLPGAYVASEVADSIDLRSHAAALALPADAFVCDRTAAWIYTGARALGPNEHLSMPPVQYFRPSGKRAFKGGLVNSGERAIMETDLRELNGLVLTTELRTALDLGRLQPTRDLRLWGMDNMLATGAFTLDELLLQVPRFDRQRGVIMLRALAPLADPLSESFGESALRLRWYDAGLPHPQLQIPIDVDGVEVARLDMGLEEWLFAAEYDGEAWHSDDGDVEHDDERRTWLRDSRRWIIEVFRRQHVFGRQQDADLRLRRAAHEARARFGERVFVI